MASFHKDGRNAPGQEVTWVVLNVQSTSESASWVKGKTTGAKFPPRGAGSPASSGGPSFPMITGETFGRAEIV